MIKENQRTLNYINVALDALLIILCMPVAYVIRVHFFPFDPRGITLPYYLILTLCILPVFLVTLGAMSLYESLRTRRLHWEIGRLFWACAINFVVLQTMLFLIKQFYFSRLTFVLYFILVFFSLSCKRLVVRLSLHRFRKMGYNQKHVLLLGNGPMAKRYIQAIASDSNLGFLIDGYLAQEDTLKDLGYLGVLDDLAYVLSRYQPEEVVAALAPEEFSYTPIIIECCEKEGVKLSIVPFYAQYMPSNPQFDSINGVPIMNIRRIPLDNMVYAAAKRFLDIVGSLVLIVLTSPFMLFAAVGVRLSSPGPIIFRQERVGLHNKPFYMYKFRSMRVNAAQDTGWSRNRDPRKTKFGALIRKLSIDELPQLFNVLKGDMSLVGPRPEIPHFVEQFKDEIPLYMVKHQVRPGITGWAQINGLRGDTSIVERIRHDIYYIENWSIFLDFKILLMTPFKGIVNQEKLR
ncbi:undecaprenyl-phosphate glucose phosphotransferase [Pseudoflavonifractor capillosus]|uniref:undecaprenyl-phosphate glucose phosphotransferase n=1 Tax=Pseudoflavonifractor capillosus TaxID=106588 RepID=UPI0019591695|nr:undecaprenyl-phosphate glucose phosphotransferase [Pseudoflavonifractor capillosus]MBM6896603.1 undecaprenyl-phosphate glucose phosphotransferase [Pseudoflavonifractor capillosus]